MMVTHWFRMVRHVKKKSQSMSVLPSCSARPTSKFRAFNSALLPVPQTINFSQFRSVNTDQKEDHDGNNMDPNDSTPEEKEWRKRVFDVAERLSIVYSQVDHSYFLEMNDIEFYSIEKEKLAYRERWATFRLLHKIEDVARRLIDDNVDKKCQVFYLVNEEEKWILDRSYKEAHYDKCWLSLLESSEQPLTEKLRNELNEAGISFLTFSQSMNKVYHELQDKYDKFGFWSIEIVDYKPDDVEKVLSNLPINDTDYECIKILYNIEESEKWQIRDCERK